MSESLSDTIVPKSDQLNADDLLCGPITVTVESVKRGDRDQPVVIGIEGRQPYKPCKSMRRVLIAAWGDKGSDWVGKSMTLYCDPGVMFGGVKVGGIRISHLSHIETDRTFLLTMTRGKRGEFHVKRLVESVQQRTPEELYASAKAKIASAEDKAPLDAIRSFVQKLAAVGTFSEDQARTLNAKIEKRLTELEGVPA